MDDHNISQRSLNDIPHFFSLLWRDEYNRAGSEVSTVAIDDYVEGLQFTI